MIETKAFRVFSSLNVIQKQARANIKLSLHKRLFGSIMIYAFSVLESAANTCQLTLQWLRSEAFRIIDSLLRYTAVRDVLLTLNALHFYDYITELFRLDEEIFQNRRNVKIGKTEHGKDRHWRNRLATVQ
jgi:hypothetical protein